MAIYRLSGIFRGVSASLIAASWFISSTTALSAETRTYSYDALGRLTNVVSSGSVNNGVTSTYKYDAADNRTNVTVTGSPNGSALSATESNQLGSEPLGEDSVIAADIADKPTVITTPQ